MIVDISMIEAYNDWKAEKGVASKDFSPQQFQIEYAKELALERLTKVDTYLQNVIEEGEDFSALDLAIEVRKVVQGEDV